MGRRDLGLHSIEADLARLVGELYESFAVASGTDQGTEHSCEPLDSYVNRVARIGIAAGAAGYPALKDACVGFQQSLKALQRQGGHLSATQRSLLEEWPLHIAACLATPPAPEAATALVQLLRDATLPEALNADEAARLHARLLDGALGARTGEGSDPAYTAPSPAPPDPTPADTDTCAPELEPMLAVSLREEVAEIGELIETLGELRDASARTASLGLCADRVEALGMSAAGHGLLGVMDVCLLLQGALKGIAAHSAAPDAPDLQTLAGWSSRMADYLDHPGDPDTVDSLLEHLGRLPFAPQLAPADRASLNGLLLAAPTAPVAAGDTTTAQAVASERQRAPAHAAELSPQVRELLDLIVREVGECAENVRMAARGLSSEEDSERAAAGTRYAELLEPLAGACLSLRLEGLHQVFSRLQEQARTLAARGAPIDESVCELLGAWPERVADYLRAPGDAECSRRLATYLADPVWPEPLDEAASDTLGAELAAAQLHLEAEQTVPRAREASPEDVSLELPGDVNPQLLDSLLQELPAETAEFTQAVTLLHEGRASLADLDRAQRIAHTLKGSANTVGVPGVATLTHHIEDILLAYSRQERLPGPVLTGVLMDAADVLEAMSEALLGTGSAPEQAQAVLQLILDWANRIDQQGLPEDSEPMAQAATAASTAAVPPGKGQPDSAAAMLRVPASLVDELLRGAGESIILGGQLRDRLALTQRQADAIRAQHAAIQLLAAELEQMIDVRGLSSAQRSGHHDAFDALELEQYNELHTLTHRLIEATTDARELGAAIEDHLTELDGLMDDQDRLHREQQEAVMRTRMVPVQQLVPRLQRSLRQTCRLTGKQASLEVRGTETLIDSEVLADLADPLMHLLRNAVDHGIEDDARRKAAGKPSRGRVELAFAREGDQVVVRCSDDGGGLDLDAIRQRAVERGLLQADADAGPEELARLVWVSGFTTRDTSTQTSGRGIGMDAVHRRVLDLKGTLAIDSVSGEGCTIELRLPLTLISVHGLLVQAGSQVLAISSRGIEQVLHPEDGTRERDGHRLLYRIGETVHDAYYIETLLHQPVDASRIDAEQRPALVIRDETGGTHVVLIERVLASQELVVKQLGRYLPPIAGIEGATILGDGSVAPVLDLPGLLHTMDRSDGLPVADHAGLEPARAALPCALVVDDSLSARRSLAEFLQDTGYEVRTAKDGLEAIEALGERLPDIVLVDLEMPRMNGLELASHLRANDETRGIPIIMITSRSTEKHRRRAEAAGVDVYLTKPFAEDELLGHIEARIS